MKKSLSFFKYAAALIAALLIALSVAAYAVLSRSLPLLAGEIAAPGITRAVTIERYAQGNPTLRGQNRPDIAHALGFLHAQERFFQMDLLRRKSAGEFAELFGKAALEYDQRVRRHRFRERAEHAIARFAAAENTLLQAYAEGVNYGLAQLGAAPFEYWLLRRPPEPWSAADSLLCLYSMYLDLQTQEGIYDRSLAFMRSRLPPDWFAFLKPRAVSGHLDDIDTWEAPLTGRYAAKLHLPTTPLADFIDVDASKEITLNYDGEAMIGSNNWGVNGRLTRSTMNVNSVWVSCWEC